MGVITPNNSNIYFGAYGEGAKPNIYGSYMNFAEAKWDTDTANIWYVENATCSKNNDAGLVVFNDGKAAGTKRATLAEVVSEGDFYYEPSSDRVYLYSKVNPADAWESIEIGANSWIFDINNVENITIDNLNIRYTGGEGIVLSNAKNVKITNCEIAYIGGSYMTHTEDTATRYGNGVEMWCAGSGLTVDNCWVHQIYDSGLTHQGTGTVASNSTFTQENITFSNNLVEYCGLAAIEYWTSNAGNGFNYLENINYTGNILRFAGYGIGALSTERTGDIIRTDAQCMNHSSGKVFNITNNILDTATGSLANLAGCHYQSVRPTLSGNTFMQYDGRAFGKLVKGYNTDGSSQGVTTYYVNDSIGTVVSSNFGDKTATVVIYK